MSFEDRLEQGAAPAWRPDQEDADLLVGTIADIDSGHSEYVGAYPILTILKEDGSEVAVHAFHSVLRNELIKKRPQIGEKIGIKFLGEVLTKPGSKFKSFIGYRVRIDRTAGEFDWNRIGADPEPEPAYEEQQSQRVTVPADAAEDDIPF